MSFGSESLDGLERFLNAKPQSYAVAVGVRAAERVFPLLAYPPLSDADAKAKVFVGGRALLVASALRLDISPKARPFAEVAAEAAKLGLDYDANPEEARFVVENVSEAIVCAAFLPIEPSDTAATHAAEAAMFASDAVSEAAYRRTQSDNDNESTIAAILDDMSFLVSGGTPQELMRRPLWSSGVPACISDTWRTTRRRMRDWPSYKFWIEWYDSVIGRRSISERLLRDVAQIQPSDWDLGPEHVSKVIEEIELAWIHVSFPLAETIEWTSETQKLRAIPIPIANPKVWETVIDKLRDAIRDMGRDGVLKQHHTALGEVLSKLERTLSTYADNPQRVHDDMSNALLEMGRSCRVWGNSGRRSATGISSNPRNKHDGPLCLEPGGCRNGTSPHDGSCRTTFGC